MRLFVTLPTREVPKQGANQWLGPTLGRTEPHVLGCSIPLPLWGEWVYTIDVAPHEAMRYEIANPLGSPDRNIKYFYLPVDRLRGILPTQYQALTGRRWDEVVITLKDAKARRPQDAQVSWALVWGSRSDVADLRVTKHTDQEMLLTLRLSPTFDFTRDYICVERHTEKPNSKVASGIKESWWLEHLVGFAPAWATFPPEWKAWCYNADVQQSAERYILSHLPELAEDIREARMATAKENVIRLWHVVKDKIDRMLREELGPDVTMGKIASNTWTAVTAMPLRIAQRLGNYVETDWVPPIPKPEYVDPDQSGRVLLANPTGAHPSHGLGVGESMSDRYFLRREGEMSRRQTVPSTVDYASPYR